MEPKPYTLTENKDFGIKWKYFKFYSYNFTKDLKGFW